MRPFFFILPCLSDPEPGYWVLTKYEDIKDGFHESSRFSLLSTQLVTLLTLGSEENRHPKLI